MTDAFGQCGGGVYGQHRTEPCMEEPFLHYLSDDETHGFTCTRHVKVLKYLRLLDFNGKPQVHEVTPECLDPESVWDVEENCCVLEEEEPLPNHVAEDTRPLVYYGEGRWGRANH